MRGIRKAFGATVALDGVDIAVAGGEVCALVGQNGAGKSTLMASSRARSAPTRATMTLDGADYRPRDPLDARRAGVAMIYQELSIAPHLSVAGEHRARRRAGTVRRDRSRARRAPSRRRRLAGSDTATWTRPPAGDLSVAAQQIVEIAGRCCERQPRARLRRADEQSRTSGRAAPVRARRRARGGRGSPSSTSRISSRR